MSFGKPGQICAAELTGPVNIERARQSPKGSQLPSTPALGFSVINGAFGPRKGLREVDKIVREVLPIRIE